MYSMRLLCTVLAVPYAFSDTCGKPQFSNTDFMGHDLVEPPAKVRAVKDCCALCSSKAFKQPCVAYTFHADSSDGGSCYCKSSTAGSRHSGLHLSGLVHPATPEERAKDLLNKMTLDEKLLMLAGHGSEHAMPQHRNLSYIGRVGSNNLWEKMNHSIPDLHLNDAGNGFRVEHGNDEPGSTTQWPSSLNMGASWNIEAAHAWGVAMGQEFYGKGANVQLGPGMCIARFPRNGRNFEYAAGEDPFLGYVMVQPVITGIQSQGVLANAKHWVNNNQEINRSYNNAIVDERTRFEIYYPAFEGAVEAEVASFMCGYNLINGEWTCQNHDTLQVDLKQRLGFKGWVMSDWGATHSASMNAGLDQEMPASQWFNNRTGGNKATIADLLANSTISMETLNQSTERVLTQMFKFGLFDRRNANTVDMNVSSAAHDKLARELATQSMVLLKNDGDVLPLNHAVKKVAVIGEQAWWRDAPQQRPITGGQGSGSVKPPHVVNPLESLLSRFQASLNSSCLDSKHHHLPCEFSGTNGRSVVYDMGNNATRAAALAESADVTLLFVATDSGEGHDRADLKLNAISYNTAPRSSYEASAEYLIETVAKSAQKLVVVMVHPGAILTDWRDKVDGIVAAFLPGQEYGDAVMDVLWGDVEPTARLPITLPATENDLNFCPEQYPGIPREDPRASERNHGWMTDTTYSEKLEVGYRYYDAHGTEPAYPFGHGLGYAKFSYSNLKVDGDFVNLTVSNIGQFDGTEVVQLYLNFPEAAGEPPKQLKAFERIFVGKGKSADVKLPLSKRSLSIWDVSSHSWQVQHGTFIAMVGASSRDIRLTKNFTVSVDTSSILV